MEKKEFERILRESEKKIRKDFIKAIAHTRPDNAVIFMGKHEPDPNNPERYMLKMQITKNISPDRTELFANAMIISIVQLCEGMSTDNINMVIKMLADGIKDLQRLQARSNRVLPVERKIIIP